MFSNPNSDTISEAMYDSRYSEMKLHMRTLLRQKLVNCDINIRTLCSLERSGIRTLGDLVKHTRDEVSKMHRMGVVSLTELDKMLLRYGLHYGMTIKE